MCFIQSVTNFILQQTVLRIWDCLFYEGSKIIFRVALTLIKQHQDFILEATNFPEICEKFKQITTGSFVTECHIFMQVGVILENNESAIKMCIDTIVHKIV